MDVKNLHGLLLWRPPPLKFLIGQGVLAEGSKAILFGNPKLGKSVLVQQIGFCVASGQDWLGIPTQPAPVLYIQAEIHPSLFRDRMLKTWNMAYNFQHQFEYNTATAIPTPKLDTVDGMKLFRTALFKYKPRLLIIDPLYRFATLDMEHLQKVVDNIDRLIYEFNLTVIVVHHPRKTQTDQAGSAVNRGGEELWGSRILEWYFDSIIYLQGDTDTDDRVLSFTLRNAITQGLYKNLYLDRNRLVFVVK